MAPMIVHRFVVMMVRFVTLIYTWVIYSVITSCVDCRSMMMNGRSMAMDGRSVMVMYYWCRTVYHWCVVVNYNWSRMVNYNWSRFGDYDRLCYYNWFGNCDQMINYSSYDSSCDEGSNS